MYAFVWLPREQLTTARRLAIGKMISDAAGVPFTSWTIDVGDDELALLRFTFAVDPGTKIPNVDALDEGLVEMVRG